MSKTELYKCDIYPCIEAAEILGQTVHYLKTTTQTEDRLLTLNKPILHTAELDLCEKHYQLYVGSLAFTGADDGRLNIVFEERKK